MPVLPVVAATPNKVQPLPDDDPDRLHVTPTAEELQVAEELPIVPPAPSSLRSVQGGAGFVAGGPSHVAGGVAGGNGTGKPEYNSRSEGSSSSHESCSCSFDSSSSRSRSRSRSRSPSYTGSSSGVSEPGELFWCVGDELSSRCFVNDGVAGKPWIFVNDPGGDKSKAELTSKSCLQERTMHAEFDDSKEATW